MNEIMHGIVINNVAIPMSYREDMVEGIDLVEPFNYYPNYLRFGGELNPAGYLNKILATLVKSGGRRNKVLSDFGDYLGSEFLSKMEFYHTLFVQKYKEKEPSL